MSNLDFKYFYEDEVFRVSKKGSLQFGMVVENAEFASSDEEDDEDEEPVKKGHVRVAWYPSGSEEIVLEKKVHLADRSLMPGDVVRRLVRGKDTQRGYCRNITVTASVQILGTKQVIFGVDSRELTPLEMFTSDVLVCLGGWVGMIREVNSKLTVRFSDGSKVVVDDTVAENLDDIRDKRDSECEFKRYDFYPGQILFGPIRMIEDGEWLECSKDLHTVRRNKPHKAYKMTVEDIDFHSIGVSWTCRSYTGTEDDSDKTKNQPNYLVEGDDLKNVKMLNVFEPCTLQIGDRNFYTIKETDILMMKNDWRKLQKDMLMKGKKVEEAAKVAKKNEQLIEVVTEDDEGNSSDYEDIDEEGGNESDAVSVSSTDSHKDSIDGKQAKKKKHGQPALMTKVLKKKKLKKTKKAAASQVLMVKPGDRVVVETLSTRSEADVVWQDGSLQPSVFSSELYPIHHLDDNEFFPGDFVVEAVDGFHDPHSYGVVQEVEHAGRCCRVKWFKTYTAGNQPQPLFLESADVSVYDLKDHPDFKYRPASIVIRVANYGGDECGLGAGQVLDNHPSGQVSVWWAGEDGGTTSSCWPQDLYKVGEYDSDDGELWGDSEDDSDNESWATEDEEEVAEDEALTEEEDLKPKLAANIEKARIAMARLEEIFKDNPTLQTAGVMKQLLDVYKDCRYLDRLMGTEFFHERHFQGLLERIRDHGRISTMDLAVQEQVTRLFSDKEQHFSTDEGRENKTPLKESCEEVFESVAESSDKTPGRDSGHGSFIDKSSDGGKKTDEVPSSQVCARLCSLIKSQLVKSHEEVVARFGGDSITRAIIDNVVEGEDEDLEMMVSRGLRALNFVPMASPESWPDFQDAAKNVAEEADVKKRKSTKKKLANSAVEKNKERDEPLSEDDLETLKTKMKILTKITKSLEQSQSSAATSTNTSVTDIPDDGEDKNHEVKKESSREDDVTKSSCNEEGVRGASCLPDSVPLTPGSFITEESVPVSHKFKLTMFQPSDMKNFVKFVRREVKLLRSSLPPGIRVKGFDDRMDLYSAYIEGPKNTPYEDGLFFFDFQLGPDYPSVPPTCHYISYCCDRLNPNLYEDGKVCVSLLGTWSGKGTETWTPNSNLLQLLVSIQGLILVNEPYFNEAGYERQKGTQQGRENSRMYNEMALLKMVQSMNRLIQNPPTVFHQEIREHFQTHAARLIARLEKWRRMSMAYNTAHPTSPTTPGTFSTISTTTADLPEFPLIPASRGFCITLEKTLDMFRKTVNAAGIHAGDV